MPQIIIKRDSGYTDYLRSYTLILDGDEIGKIKNGESRTFDISPGEHTIQAKIDWCSSESVVFLITEDSIMFEVFSKLRGIKPLKTLFAIFSRKEWIGIRKLEQL